MRNGVILFSNSTRYVIVSGLSWLLVSISFTQTRVLSDFFFFSLFFLLTSVKWDGNSGK